MRIEQIPYTCEVCGCDELAEFLVSGLFSRVVMCEKHAKMALRFNGTLRMFLEAR